MKVMGQIMFPQLIGQEKAANVLKRAIQSQRSAHAYLFLGINGVGKEAAALGFARALLCENLETGISNIPCEKCGSCEKSKRLTHPNLKIVFPLPKPKERSEESSGDEYTVAQQRKIEETLSKKADDHHYPLVIDGGKEILVDHIRSLRHEFSLTSFSGKYRIVLVSQADRLRLQAANAFLKLLEEPPPGVVFILTSSREARILPTIKSRCQMLRFSPLQRDVIADELCERHNIQQDQAKTAARLAGGSWNRAREWSEGDPVKELENTVNLFRMLAKGDPGEIDIEVDKISSPTDDFLIKLNLMAQWLRDVQKYSYSPTSYSELGEDPALLKFSEFCRGRSFAEALDVIENARLDVERQVQPALVAFSLFTRLEKILFDSSTITS